MDLRTLNGELFTISRGLEEVEWWSVYKLGSGQRLFDTYVPLVQFSIARDTVTTRYAGLEMPPGERDPHVVSVLAYASADRVMREVLITADTSKQAAMLRSFADATRSLTFGEHGLKLSISENYPSPSTWRTPDTRPRPHSAIR